MQLTRYGIRFFQALAIAGGVALLVLVGLALVELHSRVVRLETQMAEQERPPRSERGPAPSGSGAGQEPTAAGSDTALLERTVSGIETLLEERYAEQSRALFERLVSESATRSLVAQTGLRYQARGQAHGTLLRAERVYFELTALPARGAVRVESSTGEELRVRPGESEQARQFVAEEQDRLDAIVETERSMQRRLAELPETTEISDILAEREMGSTRIVRDDFVLRQGFTNAAGAIVVRVMADAEQKTYAVNGEQLSEQESLSRRVAQALRSYDPLARVRATRDRLSDRLTEILSDNGFSDFLGSRSLKVGAADRAAEDPRAPVRYPIRAETGETVARFVIDPERGALLLRSTAGDISRTLEQVPVTHGLTRRAGASSEQTTFLLVGEKDGLSDSIMLVQAGPDRISAVSVPRDLYVGHLKLNQAYYAEGRGALQRNVAEISGVEIDHWVVIDFAAFGELVRTLGQIEVELSQEILDPTKRYTVDGRKRMLYFPPGKHEVKANAVLALVRARSTTTDFDRSRRQRAVVEGLKRRVDELALTEAGKLVRFFRTALNHTETDIGFAEALRYYRRYRGVQETRHLVLSPDNVLRPTYSAVYEAGLPPKAAESRTEDELGEWILRPRGNDWSLVEWYVTEWLAGASPSPERYLARRYPLTEGPQAPLFEAIEPSDDAIQLSWEALLPAAE
jgi:LCP family protein required for cell wall assembly